MYRNYKEVLEKAKSLGPVTISVAVAQDKDVLEAIRYAKEAGLAKAVLVGDETLIKPLLEEIGLSKDTKIVHEADPIKAALTAVSLVKKGEAQVLMKGLVNSSDFLKAVLDPEVGLRTGRLLSHLAVFEIPGQDRLIYITDGGMNIAPNLEEKKDILTNAILALQAIGIKKPNAAVLTANEAVHPKMQATVDAKALADMSDEGLLPEATVEGPIAFDVAISEEAAEHKGLKSKIAGKADLFLVPTIETGNVLGKALIYCAKAKMAGLILGATHPIVMTSRAETAEGKLNSIALACLAKGN
ncbi:phosphate butyryltransferase [Natronincola peptidivorans]|uniref:Phosphate butyryltransferase n=1 Tax=Natronincola peptidivorans TaxID=426128 RepID=A0A1I0HDP3_9FIRM|nr:bifunctional enoyl-CoA hydratase/phosphate acetyltransferase [Natronincola peptidivorans]SET81949.1 phosphate butyryltransferase [Natronincola peptidivorans]